MDWPDLLAAGEDRLGFIERTVIRFVRWTFEPGWTDGVLRGLQRFPGAAWIHWCTRKLLHVHGADRVPKFERAESYILVANHRSFFDLYVVTSQLVRSFALRNRILFPVRSTFFYTRPLGWVVNGVMSFFAMYPPIFRERNKIRLNVTSLAELAWIANQGGAFVGFHPEGTRNLGDDPYALLPAQRGLGQVIHATDAKVIPVFVNGLRTHGLLRQVMGNFDQTGKPIVVVFGEPIDFEDLRAEPASIKLQARIAERAMEAIRALSEEEREIRAQLPAE